MLFQIGSYGKRDLLPWMCVFAERLRPYTSYVILLLNAWTVMGMINVCFCLQRVFPGFAELLFLIGSFCCTAFHLVYVLAYVCVINCYKAYIADVFILCDSH